MTDTPLDIELDGQPQHMPGAPEYMQPEPDPQLSVSEKLSAPREPGSKPKYQVIGDKLYTQTEDGEVVIPLRFKTKLLREVKTMETLDDTEQLFWLLNAIGDTNTVAKLDELDVFETMGIVARYFAEFEKRQAAALGEASGSSNS